jgi:hypothetical protein
MPTNGNRPGEGAAHSVGDCEFSQNAAERTSQADTTQDDRGSPGSRPHSDRPNWRPGDDDADELLTQKIQDALRAGASERQLAKLLDIPRAMLWRGKLTSQIPPNLYDWLFKARVSQKQILTIAKIFRGDDPDTISREIECCPKCGHILRSRSALSQKALAILEQWEADGSPHDRLEQPAAAAGGDDGLDISASLPRAAP